MANLSAPDYGPPVPPGPVRMQYMLSYKFIFENPDWKMTLLWGTLCLLSTQVIPLVGQLILVGYECEVLEVLHRTGGSRYPAFQINRFADYLARSIVPTLVGVLVSLPFVLLIGVVAIVAMIGIVVASQWEVSEQIAFQTMAVVQIVTVLLLFLLGFIWMLFITPFSLRACLTQEFQSSFNLKWAADFFRKTWPEMSLSLLFFIVTMSILCGLGLLALCIGAFVAFMVVSLADTHLYFQLYGVYLSRGGQPLPLRPGPLLAALPAAAPPPGDLT